MKITSVLLAGGLNKRMNGIPKWELKLGNETMLERAIRKLKVISQQILIVSGGDYQFHVDDPAIPVQVLYDQTPYLGPLNGLLTALKSSEETYHFIVAADMPFFSKSLASHMADLAVAHQLDIVIPRWEGKLQPLHGIYSSRIRNSIEADITLGKHSLIKWIKNQQNIRILEEKEIRPFNQSGRIFFNMNSPEEYEKAQIWLIEEE